MIKYALAVIVAVTLLVLAIAVFADTQSPPPLTEVETLRVENLQLEALIVKRAMNDWNKKALTLKTDLEKSRPGWSWSPDDNAWTKIEDPKTPKDKK